MIYTLTLNPCVDCVLRAEKIARGRTNRAFAEEIAFGGKGVNVSRALARLGVPSVALGFAAGFTGDALAASFADEPLITPAFTRLCGGLTRINFKLSDGVETEVNAPGPEVAPDETEALLRGLDVLEEGDTLVISGSAPASLGAEVFARAAERACARGARFAADVSGAALTACLPFRPLLIKPNRQELEELFGAGADIGVSARKLQSAGARNVLVSLGADGAMLIDEAGERHDASAPRRAEGNTFGAGDAMVAGFIAGIDRGAEEALALAMRCAAEVVSR